LVEKINDYIKKSTRLRAIRIEYGTNDSYSWIPKGCIYLARLLKKAKIEYELLTFDGDHRWDKALFERDMLPFFSENIKVK
jgi:hypothetical protein